MNRLLSILAPTILVLALLAGWEIACRVLAVPTYVLPPPSAVAVAAIDNAPVLLASAWNTLAMALIALVTASIVACGLALLVAPSLLLESAVRPGPGVITTSREAM